MYLNLFQLLVAFVAVVGAWPVDPSLTRSARFSSSQWRSQKSRAAQRNAMRGFFSRLRGNKRQDFMLDGNAMNGYRVVVKKTRN